MRGLAVISALFAGAVALWAGPTPVSAQAGGVLAGCADPDLPPTDTLTLCQRALRDSRLRPDQRAGVLVNLGVAQAALGRQTDAEQAFTLAIATDPDLVAAYANRARSRLARGSFTEAMADFDAAIERAPGDALLWLGRGGAQLRAGNAAAAVTDLTRAIGLKSDLLAAHFNRGVGYLLLGEDARAAADFSTVVAATPDDAGAYLNRARALSARRPGQAEVDFDKAVSLDPEWGRAWAARGLFLEERGRREEANRDFLRAYELGERERWLVERVEGLR
ncbi:MAG: tetratricopeptide repeat protein [Pikeienuella sp.]